MTLAERVASLEATTEHTKEAVDRIEFNQRKDAAELHTKLSAISSQMASLNTEIKSDKAKAEGSDETNKKWKSRLYVAGSGAVGGISVALSEHYNLISKLLNIFK